MLIKFPRSWDLITRCSAIKTIHLFIIPILKIFPLGICIPFAIASCCFIFLPAASIRISMSKRYGRNFGFVKKKKNRVSLHTCGVRNVIESVMVMWSIIDMWKERYRVTLYSLNPSLIFAEVVPCLFFMFTRSVRYLLPSVEKNKRLYLSILPNIFCNNK